MIRIISISKVIFICLILFRSNSALANQAYFEIDTIYEGDIAVMVVEYQNDQPSLFLLDTTVLQSDFEVLRVDSSVNREVDNNRLINTMRWIVYLHPQRAGVIVTPNLDIRGYKTPSLRLKVNKIPLDKIDKTQFRVEATTDQLNYYAGQQIQLNMRLVYNRPIIEGDFGEPKADDFRRYRSGRERRYQQEVDGELFDVIERKIVLISDKPGTLIIPSVEFKGLLDAENLIGNNQGRRLLRRSAPIELVIHAPVKSQAADYWIPASKVQATQVWDIIDSELTIGTSVIRQLSLMVKGVPAENLPTDLFSTNDSALDIYSDRESIRNEFQQGDIVGRLDQDYVIVLAKSGEVWIPDINIVWWNVLTNHEQITVLPGKTLSVDAVAAGASNPDINSNQSRLSDFFDWLKINVGLLILILIVFILCLIFFRQLLLKNTARKFSWWRMFRACRQNNPVLAKQEVLLWAARQWPELRHQGLLTISDRKLSDDLSKSLMELDACLYQKSQATWNGDQLWKSLRSVKLDAPGKPEQRSFKLPALYPE